MEKDHLDQIHFFVLIQTLHPYHVLCPSQLLLSARTILSYASLQAMKIHVKQMTVLDICKHPKLLIEEKGKAACATTQTRGNLKWEKGHIYMLLNNGLCKQNKVRLQCTFSWCSWEHRDIIWKGNFHGSCIPCWVGLSSPTIRTAVILLPCKVCRCAIALLPKTIQKVTSERNDSTSSHSAHRARRRNHQASLP